MQTENSMKLEFLSLSCNEAFARAAIGAFIAPLDPTMEELGDIKTAVSEAVTNCIVHAYPKTTGNITLSCIIHNDHTVELSITDQGVGIPDIKAARAPLFTTGGQERSGMGFTIMERFMNSLTVESTPEQGTTITMTRKLRSAGAYS